MSKPWGSLLLASWETANNEHPLPQDAARKVALAGADDVIVGRNSKALLKLSKAMIWVSNKHFTLRHDEQAGKTWLRDLSSNGTWVNKRRVRKETDHPLHPGDVIELAAEDGRHQQLTFKFLADGGGKGGDGDSAGDESAQPAKKQRVENQTADPHEAAMAAPPPRAELEGTDRPAAGSASPAARVAAVQADTTTIAATTPTSGAPEPPLPLPQQESQPLPPRPPPPQEHHHQQHQQQQSVAEQDATSLLRAAEERWRVEMASVLVPELRALEYGEAMAKEGEASAQQEASDRGAQLVAQQEDQQKERDQLMRSASESHQQLQRALEEQGTLRDMRAAAEEEVKRLRAAAEGHERRLAEQERRMAEMAAELERERCRSSELAEEQRRDKAHLSRMRDAMRQMCSLADEMRSCGDDALGDLPADDAPPALCRSDDLGAAATGQYTEV